MINYIIWFFISMLSTFSFAYLFYKLTDANKKINLKIILLYFFGVIGVLFVEHAKIINYIFFFVYFPIFFRILNPMPLNKIYFYVLIVWFYGMVADILSILVTSLVFYIFNIDFNLYLDYNENVSMFLTICVSIILIILGHRKFMNVKIKNLYTKIEHIKYVDVLLVVFSLFILGMALIMFLNVESLNINLLITLVIILMVLTFVVLFKYKIDDRESKQYLKTLKENNEFYIKRDDENRVFKHNLIAKLMSIKSVSNKKSMSLIEDLISQFNKNEKFSENIKVIPYGLNGIIYQKLYPYLKKLSIDVNNEIDYDIFNVLKPRRYNVLVEKLVIALDNAIESSLKSKQKIISIYIYDDNNNICIEVKNSFSSNMDVDLIGNKNYSTKGKKHGLGLFSALRNNEALLSVKIVNDMFITKISAKKQLID